ncbi:signal peptidase I [Desulforhabdus amnigena]|uniref:Signal peptidase I n=1 Tax=Desulforhabdus amnigena TaxID=40218 RepID=A0A9W6D1E3_9BACT|nr:signal peptidase I [Desulforhabdus amnigena]NLJ26425.1 signal peptidase I [Deltaproteobacteria bacterium]GLI33189.1 signal peptidase I [Desulforhabdus amnigena]
MHRTKENEVEKNSSKSLLREYAEAIIIAVLLALVIRAFVVQAFKIPSGSMKNTLLVGDHILVNKFVYGIKLPILNKELLHFRDPERKDIVVFRYPVDPSKDFIKRVIGLPGDTVRIQDKKVYVNDQLLVEPYVVHSDPRILPASVSPRDNMDSILIPPHSLFVMGDNRDESFDSRFWKFVDMDELKGEAFIIYWSWNGDGKLTWNPTESYIRWNRIGNLLH